MKVLHSFSRSRAVSGRNHAWSGCIWTSVHDHSQPSKSTWPPQAQSECTHCTRWKARAPTQSFCVVLSHTQPSSFLVCTYRCSHSHLASSAQSSVSARVRSHSRWFGTARGPAYPPRVSLCFWAGILVQFSCVRTPEFCWITFISGNGMRTWSSSKAKVGPMMVPGSPPPNNGRNLAIYSTKKPKRLRRELGTAARIWGF